MNKKFFATVICSVVIGFFLAIYSLQFNDTVKKQCEYTVQQLFAQSFNCKVTNAQLSNIDLFGMNFVAHAIKVRSAEGDDWYWSAEKITIHFGWFDLFKLRKIKLELMLQGLESHSCIKDNTLAIGNHLKQMICGSQDSPIELKSLIIRKGCCQITNADKSIQMDVQFAAEIRNQSQHVKARLYLTNAELINNKNKILNVGYTKIRADVIDNVVSADAHAVFWLEQLGHDQNEYLLDASWNIDQGNIGIYSKDKNCYLQTSTLSRANTAVAAEIVGQIPLPIINKLTLQTTQTITGTVKLTAHVEYGNDLCASGTVRTDDSTVAGISLGDWATSFARTDKIWNGLLSFKHSSIGSFNGSWQHNETTAQGSLNLDNATIIDNMFSYWQLQPGDCTLQTNWVGKQAVVNYSINAIHNKLNEHSTVTGSMNINDDRAILTGSFNDNKYKIECNIPDLKLTQCQLNDTNNQPIVTINTVSSDEWHGIIQLAGIQPYLQKIVHEELHADGILSCNVKSVDETFTVSLHMDNGIVHHLQMYNFINGLNAHLLIDKKNLKICCDTINLKFHKGSIRVNSGVIGWNKRNNRAFVHVPVLVDKIFFNNEKNIFAVLSGSLLCQHDFEEGILFSGKLWCNKGQINKNILSASLLRTLLARNHSLESASSKLIKFNLNFESKKPFNIKTSFLNTDAHFSGNIKGTLSKPQLSGSLWLTSGTLSFPYKPLYITNAKLYFNSPDLFDPAFELVAKGSVKNYTIVLRSSGSLTHPHLSFESTPPLQEEQIIGLLLAGTEKESIALIMPSLIVQNMQSIIFGPDQSEVKVASYFQKLLSPLSNIRIVPSFDDQTGRGGMRWALEVDLNDRLRAMIQKNFSQPEDTVFEVEYALANDIVLRGIKDEHSDLGGEVEIRWKF